MDARRAGPAQMMYAPVALYLVGRPVVFASTGHMIIQSRRTVIRGFAVSQGSESLRAGGAGRTGNRFAQGSSGDLYFLIYSDLDSRRVAEVA